MLSRLRAPNTFVLLFSFLCLVAALTWILPGGAYERQQVEGRELVVAGSFHPVEANPQGPGAVLMAPVKGFEGKGLIIGFVFLVGGVFGILHETKAIQAGIDAVVAASRKREWVRRAAIPVFMILFSLGGAVFGMSEEVIPFVLVFIPLALALGYDTVTGIAIPFVGAGAGFAGAFFNPFTLQIAQGIAEIELVSGWEYRAVVWVLTTAVAIVFVSLHAHRVARDPSRSPTPAADAAHRQRIQAEQQENSGTADSAGDERPTTEGKALSGRAGAVLLAFALGMLVLVWGVGRYQWYIAEICAVFLGIGLAAALLGRLSAGQTSDAFVAGAKDLTATALVIALAQGILVIASDGRIIDTILHGLAGAIGQVHPIVTAQLMVLVQSAINFVVPSGSGQAALTMPVMAPLADLTGVSRQTAVLAFQFGDGFSNLIIPTSAVTMGVLTLAKVEWAAWARWLAPLFAIFLLLALLLMIPPFFIGW
ncbi:MAG: TIGR00366 family protein [Acidobacteriota bacterium]